MPYALCPMPYALCPMPYAHEYLIFLRKAISAIIPKLIDNYDSSDPRHSLFDLIYTRKSRERSHISFLRPLNQTLV